MTIKTTTPPTLYFAYGSNLSLVQMSQRCPSSPYYGLGRLPGYTWIIGERGYANVIKSAAPSGSSSNTNSNSSNVSPPSLAREDGEAVGIDYEGKTVRGVVHNKKEVEEEEDYVVGMLYVLSPTDEARLDKAEGVPYAYSKHTLPIEMLSCPEDVVDGQAVVQALVYVDEIRLGEGVCKEEYIHRMNRGIEDAVKMGMPREYVERVLRKFVREEAVGAVVHDPFLGMAM